MSEEETDEPDLSLDDRVEVLKKSLEILGMTTAIQTRYMFTRTVHNRFMLASVAENLDEIRKHLGMEQHLITDEAMQAGHEERKAEAAMESALQEAAILVQRLNDDFGMQVMAISNPEDGNDVRAVDMDKVDTPEDLVEVLRKMGAPQEILDQAVERFDELMEMKNAGPTPGCGCDVCAAKRKEGDLFRKPHETMNPKEKF